MHHCDSVSICPLPPHSYPLSSLPLQSSSYRLYPSAIIYPSSFPPLMPILLHPSPTPPPRYILSMGSVDEVEDYISDLGGEDNSKRKEFITKLHRRWCQMSTPVTPPTTSTSSTGGVSRKLAPPPGLERRPQNMCAEGWSISDHIWMVVLSG